jgi:phosphate transport system substrate-binding protein
MRTSRRRLALVVSLLTCGAAACGPSAPASAPIVIDGSSTLHPISVEAADQYRKKHPRQEITVGVTSTGVGLKRFCAGELDIADASRHVTADEAAACAAARVDFVELPVAYDAISLIVNRNNTWASSMIVGELKTLWAGPAEGVVTRWRQVREGWPDREIHLVGPDRESGTFAYFNEAISGAPTNSRKDYAGHEDDNDIVKAVEADELALGYVGFTYYMHEAERLKAVAIDDLVEDIGPGPIAPTLENVRRGVYRPLSRPLFIYVRASSLNRPEVQQFVEFYARFAPDIVERAGGVRLRPRESELALARITKRVLGTMFAAPTTGEVSLEQRMTQQQ